MKYTFETPKIVGALCESEKEIPAELTRRFNRLKANFAFLPFVVERRHLKNTVACMKLVDVAGLVVCGRHRSEIGRHLTHMNAEAKRSGEVDCVVRKAKRFVGINLSEVAKSQNVVAKPRRAKNPRLKTTVKQRLIGKKAMGDFYQSIVELLTQGS